MVVDCVGMQEERNLFVQSSGIQYFWILFPGKLTYMYMYIGGMENCYMILKWSCLYTLIVVHKIDRIFQKST